MSIKELLRENSFKLLDKDDAAIAIDGNIAFNIDGTYKYFDKNNEEIVECEDFTLMQIGNMFMRALTTEIKVGDDIILYDTEDIEEDTELFSLSHVLEVKGNKVKAIKYDDGTIVTNKSIPSMLFKNTKFYVKIMPLMPGLNVGNAENNPFMNMLKDGDENNMNQQMLMMMAMNNSEGNNNMLKTMMLMNMANGNSGNSEKTNPMLMMMAMNNGEGENDMLKTMMLMNMANGNSGDENNMNQQMLMMMAMNNGEGENDMLKTMMLMNMMKGGDMLFGKKEEKKDKKDND